MHGQHQTVDLEHHLVRIGTPVQMALALGQADRLQ
jgi:hypothetical protein